MKHTFTFEFLEDQKNRNSFQYSPESDEELDTLVENGIPILYLNRPAMLTLAKILIKMGLGTYDYGFHVHLNKDFNAYLPDRLTDALSGSSFGVWIKGFENYIQQPNWHN